MSPDRYLAIRRTCGWRSTCSVLLTLLMMWVFWTAGSYFVQWAAEFNRELTHEFYASHKGREFVFGVEEANRPPRMACGMFGNVLVEFLASYMPFWVEYDGDHAFSPSKNDANLKTGCSAQIDGVLLGLSWPELLPEGNKLLDQAVNFEGISLALSKWAGRYGSTDLSRLLDWRVSNSHELKRYNAAYVPSLGLYRININSGAGRPGDAIFWAEEGGEIDVIIRCAAMYSTGKMFTCRATFGTKEVDTLIEARFTPEKLKAWREIQQASRQFIINSVKRN